MTQFVLIDLKGFRWKPICGDRVENSDSLNRSPCCPRAARGHAAAAPPSATSNSRRPMVTVIRPSRARCVKGTIPRHERAVLIAPNPSRAGRTPGTDCDGVCLAIVVPCPVLVLPAGRARAVSQPGSQRAVTAAQLLATVRHPRSRLCVGGARARGESRYCSKRRWMRMQGQPNRRALAG